MSGARRISFQFKNETPDIINIVGNTTPNSGGAGPLFNLDLGTDLEDQYGEIRIAGENSSHSSDESKRGKNIPLISQLDNSQLNH